MCRGVDTGQIADRAQHGQVERSVCEFLTAQIAVTQRTARDCRANALIFGIGPRLGRELHLRSVREISVAGIIEVRSATHEVLFHAEQIGAIVQVMLMLTLTLSLVFTRWSLMLLRLRRSFRRLLPVRVIQRQFQGGDDGAYRNHDS